MQATLEGTIESFVWTDSGRPDNEWAIATFAPITCDGDSGREVLGSTISARGNLRRLSVGRTYRLAGELADDPRFGPVLSVQTVQTARPTTTAAAESFLGSLPGIGAQTAKALAETFGVGAVDALRQKSLDELRAEVLGAGKHRLRGLTDERLAQARAVLEVDEERIGRELKVRSMLGELGTERRVSAVLRRWGENAATEIEANPWILVELRGWSFPMADAVARHLGVDLVDSRRFDAALEHVYAESSSSGHTAIDDRSFVALTASILRGAGENSTSWLELVEGRLQDHLGLKAGAYVLTNDGLVQSREHDFCEDQIARWFAARARRVLENRAIKAQPHVFDAVEGDQRIALEKMLDAGPGGVFVLTGAPGTGKTWLVAKFLPHFPIVSRVLCAPTGKAARRLTESVGQIASTIHKALEPTLVDNLEDDELRKRSREKGLEFVFKRHSKNPLDASLVVVDEASMVDAKLFFDLIQAIPDDAYVLIVGDPNQLASVGAGSILRDVVQWFGDDPGAPIHELTEIKRSDPGLLLETIHGIRDGGWKRVANREGQNLLAWRAESEAEALDRMVELYLTRLPRANLGGANPILDTQVLIPWRGDDGKRVLSCRSFNDRVRSHRVSAGDVKPFHDRVKFGVGDKVLQTRNDAELGIVNGDIGLVVDKRRDGNRWSLIVKFDGYDEAVEVPAVSNDLELAYAVTIHKAQGSEWNTIVFPAMGATAFYDRSLFYTALSRAQKLAIIVGNQDLVPGILRRRNTKSRRTNLVPKLDAAIKEALRDA